MILGAPYIVPIYFVYGLAFFSMGLLVAIEGGRASDVRLRRALPPLAAFGLIHAAHEWIGMYLLLDRPLTDTETAIIQAVQLATLAFSFISLSSCVYDKEMVYLNDQVNSLNKREERQAVASGR